MTAPYTYLIGPDASENDDIARQHPNRTGYRWDDAGDVAIGWVCEQVWTRTYEDEDGEFDDRDFAAEPCSLADVLAALPEDSRDILRMHADSIADALESDAYHVDEGLATARRLSRLAELVRELA